MAIAFNNIPTTVRTPGVVVEIDNSRALTGLVGTILRRVCLMNSILTTSKRVTDGGQTRLVFRQA